MRERTCCFTGHRDIPVDQLQMVMANTEAKVRDILQKLISSNQSKYLQESIIKRIGGI